MKNVKDMKKTKWVFLHVLHGSERRSLREFTMKNVKDMKKTKWFSFMRFMSFMVQSKHTR
jgi:hypothetical protein